MTSVRWRLDALGNMIQTLGTIAEKSEPDRGVNLVTNEGLDLSGRYHNHNHAAIQLLIVWNRVESHGNSGGAIF